MIVDCWNHPVFVYGACELLMQLIEKRHADDRPLVVHLVYRFDTGGLENGIVNLLNNLPSDAYRNMVIALTEVGDFSKRILCNDVAFFSLGKKPGHSVGLYPRLFRIFRELRPAIVHTRNLAALEATVPAWLAGVPVRIHGEHGWDVGDFHGMRRKNQLIRKLYRPFVSHYIALSTELVNYLEHKVNISPGRISHVCNGVDLDWFSFTRPASRSSIAGCPFTDPDLWLIGTVGRMQVVKDQTTLAQAFIDLLATHPGLRARVRLIMVGEGPLRNHAFSLLAAAGLEHMVWLPGERSDIAEILNILDCFVLPSRAEGISNTILEAMASSLPVLATNVGGNSELVVAGVTGELVPAGDPAAISRVLAGWAAEPERARSFGRAGRRRVQEKFAIGAMVQAYQTVYDQQLGKARRSSHEEVNIHVRNHGRF